MDRPTAAPAPHPRRRRGLALAALASASAALLAPGERPARAASPLTIGVPIAIDGDFSDWDAVLANPLQTTRDGDGSSAAIEANCSAYSTDRDCPQTGGAGNDFLTFAWTYDATSVYLYVERYGSSENPVDFLFVADVDRDRRVRRLNPDGSPSQDVVVRAKWSGQTRNVALDLWGYDPADDVNGDPIVCTPVAPATACANAAGLLAAPAGYVDGYKLPGENVGSRDCTGCSGRGGAGGVRVEIAVPWSAFGTTVQQPFHWHAVSSNNAFVSSTVDNIGAPDGRLGSFVQRGVSLGPDRSGAVLSPGEVTYLHTLANDGNDEDLFDLVATSSQGAQVEVLEGGEVVGRDLTGDGTWEFVLAGRDADADGSPDVSLAAGETRDVAVRIAMPAGRSGEDVTRLTATSAGDPLVSATATDTSHVGTASFVPAAHAAHTVAGQSVPFAESLVNGQAADDTFELAVDAGCAGHRVALALDASGSPGAVLAEDADGDGAFETAAPDADGDGRPELGPVAAGAASALHLIVTPRPGAAAGTACTVALTATSPATGATARVTHAVTVANAVTFAPDHRGAVPALADASDTQIPSGGAVFFPATIRNAEASARAYALAQTQTGGGGLALVPRVWSDPNGDGSPSDGAVITQTGVLSPFGGTQHVVVEVRAGTAPTGSFLVTTTTATALSGGAAAAQVSEAVVGFLAVFADALHADASNAFAPCATVYVEARGLAAGDVGSYALEWAPPSGPAPAGVSPWPTTARGTAEAQLALAADAALGPWTARLLEGATLPRALEDDVGFEVVLPSSTPRLATDRARYLPGDAVAVTASVRNDSAAPLAGTALVYSGPTTRVRSGVSVAPGAIVADAFTLTLPADAAPGARTLDLGWRLACAGEPFATASAAFDVAPPPPAVGAPGAGARVADATPAISGSALPGATVVVNVDDPAGARTSPPLLADGAGAWSWTVPDADALAEGAHAVTATQASGGVVSDPSAPVAFTVDTVPPSAPAISSPAPGTLTGIASVEVSGAATDPEAVAVEILADGAAVATAPVAGGAFSATVALSDGTHELAARALDAAGNASAASSPVSVTVDTVAPAAPALAAASPTRAQPVPFTGTAEPLASVDLLEGGVVIATVDAAADGTFSASAPLAEGAHAVAARATDAAGNAGPDSAELAVLVDRTAPAEPVVVAPADGETLGAADLVLGQVVFSGTAEALALVEIEVDGVAAAQVLADALGAWSAPATVAGGAHTARARATDVAGNASALGVAVAFALDATIPQSPVLSSPAGPVATNALDLLVAGTAEPGATIRVYLDGVLVDEATADGLGAFASDVVLPAGDGTAQLTVVAADAAGNASPPTAPVAILVDRAAPAAPVVAVPADGAFLATSTVTVSGAAEPLSTVRVTAATGETVAVTAAADGTFQAALSLPDGPATLAVRSTDAAGNFAEASLGVTVDTAAPAAPAIASPAGGASTNAATLDVSGTAPADAVLVRILDGGALVATGTPAGGAFAVSLSPGEGAHAYTAVAVDAAGNASAPSPAVAVTVDRTAPAAPGIDAPADGAAFAPGEVDVSGTAEPGTRIDVTVAGVTRTATAAGDGTWTVAIEVPAGAQTISATATDAAGNASAASAVDVVARTDDGAVGGGGCGCRTTGGAGPLALLALLALAPPRRRAR